MRAIRPVDPKTVRADLERASRSTRECPTVDRSAIESRDRLRRIFELMGAPLPRCDPEAGASLDVQPLMTVREVSAITGLSPSQVHGDLKRFSLPYAIRWRGRAAREAVVPSSTFAALLELRTVRSYNGGIAECIRSATDRPRRSA